MLVSPTVDTVCLYLPLDPEGLYVDTTSANMFHRYTFYLVH